MHTKTYESQTKLLPVKTDVAFFITVIVLNDNMTSLNYRKTDPRLSNFYLLGRYKASIYNFKYSKICFDCVSVYHFILDSVSICVRYVK